MVEQQQKRQIAYKMRIKDLVNGRYVKQEGWNPNYIEYNGKKVSRINVIGTILSKEDIESFQSLLLDDGTGKINARTFEKNPVMETLDIGDVVLVIGRPREYNGEMYVLIEIVKKIEDTKWILYRKAELDKEVIVEETKEEVKQETPAIEKEAAPVGPVTEESVTEEESIQKDSVSENVISKIKELDQGEGANFDDVIQGIDDGEKVISSLLSEGEIFEVSPGKLKVLE